MRFFQRLSGLKMGVRSSDIQVEPEVQLLLHQNNNNDNKLYLYTTSQKTGLQDALQKYEIYSK